MKIRDLIFHPPLSENDIRTKDDLFWILEDFFDYNMRDICLHYEDEIDEIKFLFYWNKLKEVPIQYLLGYGYFLGNKFNLNECVLIPRNETEELVTVLFEKIKHKKKIRILDIGTGSGVIILTLEMMLKKQGAFFYGVGSDVSKNALNVARYNKKRFELETTFIESDVFSSINEKFDVIVSNPPYIAKDEFVDYRVKNNEPHLALYGGDDGMKIYENILKNCKKYLLMRGMLAFEIAPERKEPLKVLLNKYLQDCKYEFLKDMNGYDRFLFVYTE